MKNNGTKADHPWKHARRWEGVMRPYTPEDVASLAGTVIPECTLARLGAERLWRLFDEEPYVKALGAMTGNQALQQVSAGLRAIYVSGWQVAADANRAGEMYPDQSLYPSNSVPDLVRAINNAFLRADQIDCAEGKLDVCWFAPIIADGEAGFGGVLNAFELMKDMIMAGAAGVHFEDQASALKKCGHMGGKVVVPVREFIAKLAAARLASDILDVPTLLIARTDADGARLLQSDADAIDQPFLTGKRTVEGYFEVNGGLEYAITRALAFAPYADMVWCETSSPDLGEAREFAQAIRDRYPRKLLAYNCSPSFNWKSTLDDATIESFQEELALMGYKFQFVTLAGFHALNTAMYDLSLAYADRGMPAYASLQEHELQLEQSSSFRAVKHQRFVGAGYFDRVQMVISQGQATTTALEESTETEQFA